MKFMNFPENFHEIHEFHVFRGKFQELQDFSWNFMNFMNFRSKPHERQCFSKGKLHEFHEILTRNIMEFPWTEQISWISMNFTEDFKQYFMNFMKSSGNCHKEIWEDICKVDGIFIKHHLMIFSTWKILDLRHICATRARREQYPKPRTPRFQEAKIAGKTSIKLCTAPISNSTKCCSVAMLKIRCYIKAISAHITSQTVPWTFSTSKLLRDRGSIQHVIHTAVTTIITYILELKAGIGHYSGFVSFP